MSTTQLRGLQLRLASLPRNRIDAAFESTLASIESNIATIFTTMSTDAERMAAIDAVSAAWLAADGTLQSTIESMVTATRNGAGLEADGSLVLPVGQNYLTGATSLKQALGLVDAAVKAEETARIAADAQLASDIADLVAAGGATATADIAAEAALRVAGDAANATAIAAEETARIAADAVHTQAIADEVTARTNLNTTLSTAIADSANAATAANSAEATTRAAADTVLQNNLDAEALARTTADGIHTAAISQEVADRTAADLAEATTRASADTALDGRVAVLEGGVASGITYDKIVVRETPAGVIDNVNKVFTTANDIYAGTETVFLNGQQLEPGAGNDYQLVGKDITFTDAPLVGDLVKVSYFR